MFGSVQGRESTGSTHDVIDLIHLADRVGTSGHSVSARVLGRSQPGNLFGHDFLECEIVIVAESLSAGFSVTLQIWRLAGHVGDPGDPAICHVARLGADTVVEVQARRPRPRASDRLGQRTARDLLARVHEVCPREVVKTSPGAYEWRRPGHA
ncbi:DUF5959 family protein [Streptomyces sp. NPDC086777]|uniref:DUF5959 family protein n=1 Tax=Streptomyces sp. NPDC086777 TaxID=3154866 RepID=UPI00344D8238